MKKPCQLLFTLFINCSIAKGSGGIIFTATHRIDNGLLATWVSTDTVMIKKIQREGYSIVMADDDIDDQAVVKQAFREANVNHVFTSVYNGVQLMEFLLKKGSYKNALESPPDIIIMDIRMNLLDGFETISTIQNYKQLHNIPIYILTTSNQEEDKKRAKELGVRYFYTKPESAADLSRIAKDIFRDIAMAGKKD
jgi:two-component system response regulator